MANCILSVAPTATRTPQYQLCPKARQAILAQADSARIAAEIESKRTVFAARNFGCCFGQDIRPNTV